MNYVIDIIIVVFILLGLLAGWKRGLIKTIVNFVGLVAIVMISYALKDVLANFLIDHLPFFKFGALANLVSLNVLIYHAIAFILIFVLLYCLLNIIIAVTGFIDTLLKFTVIWVIPSKICGAILGLLESWIYVYVILFVLSAFTVTAGFIHESKVADFMLNHTPLIANYFGGSRNAISEITNAITEKKEYTEEELKALNLRILQIEISYRMISKERAQELVDTGKVGLQDVLFGEGALKWLNI